MPFQAIPARWRRQPYSAPLEFVTFPRPAQLTIPGIGLGNLAGPVQPAIRGYGGTLLGGLDGFGFRASNSTPNGLAIGTPPADFTLWAIGWLPSIATTTSYQFLDSDYPPSGNRDFQLKLYAPSSSDVQAHFTRFNSAATPYTAQVSLGTTAQVAGRLVSLCAVSNGLSAKIFARMIPGRVLTGSATMTGTILAVRDAVYVGCGKTTSTPQNGAQVHGWAVWNRPAPDAVAAEIAGLGFQNLRPRPSRMYFFPVSGGSSYNVSLAEALSAADTLSAQLAFAPSLAEAASAADTISNTLTSARSVTETAAATDSVSGPTTYQRTVGTEAGSAADSLSSTVGGYDVTIAETASAVDSISALLSAAVALTETASAADTVSSLATLIAQLAESVSATDSLSSAINSQTYNVNLSEAASAVESLSAAWQAAVGVTEAGSATDTSSAQVAFQRALAEAVTALDVVSAGGILGVTITETGAASDSVSAPTGFGEVPPERVITIEFADRTIRIAKSRRPIRVLM